VQIVVGIFIATLTVTVIVLFLAKKETTTKIIMKLKRSQVSRSGSKRSCSRHYPREFA